MQVVPARHGWHWIKAGFRGFWAQPIVWIAIVFTHLLIMSLLTRLQIGPVPLGVAITLVLVPFFSVGFMNIARTVDGGTRPGLPLLFSGFRSAQKPLAMLGVVYLLAHVVLIGLLALTVPSGGAPDPALREGGADATAMHVALLRGNLLATVLYLPIVAAFWYAPVLVAWQGHSAGKALFFSFFAFLANWRAFILYGVLVTLIAVGLLGVSIVVFGSIGKQGGDALRLALPVYLAILMPTLYASFYANYSDVFAAPEPPKPLLEQGSS
jgi:hypothetical protein